MIQKKVILADDHQFLINGIATILKEMDTINLVATALNGFELMDAVQKYHPDLVILDLNMPGYNGLECLEKIKNAYADTKVLVLTNYNQVELVDDVRRKNGDGYLIKNSTANELKAAVTFILAGNKHFTEQTKLNPILADSIFFDGFLKKYQLTRREVDIIRLVCDEMSSKEIAASLFLSELTVTTHRRNILRKLEIKNVAGLVNFAKINMLL